MRKYTFNAQLQFTDLNKITVIVTVKLQFTSNNYAVSALMQNFAQHYDTSKMLSYKLSGKLITADSYDNFISSQTVEFSSYAD